MKPWLDEVTYGNPNDELLPYLEKGEFDFVYESLKKYPFPKNTSETTRDEMRELISIQNAPEQKNEEIMSRYLNYDEHFGDVIKTYCKEKIGVDMDEVIDQITKDGYYVLVKLKFFYQRPRPYQLAQYLRARLFPYKASSALTPAYPSGHSFESYALAEFIGSKYPEHYQFLTDLAHDISISRLFLGLHFASDLDFGRFAAKKYVGSKQFASKYGI
jgi:hypothetical protein